MWIGSAIAYTTLMATMLMAQTGKPVTSERSEPTQSHEPLSNDLYIVIKKSAHTLELFDGPNLIRSYKTAFGFAPSGDKGAEGDGKTPEGDFYVFVKNQRSRFYLSLGLSYPNVEDATRTGQ